MLTRQPTITQTTGEYRISTWDWYISHVTCQTNPDMNNCHKITWPKYPREGRVPLSCIVWLYLVRMPIHSLLFWSSERYLTLHNNVWRMYKDGGFDSRLEGQIHQLFFYTISPDTRWKQNFLWTQRGGGVCKGFLLLFSPVVNYFASG